MRRLAVLAVLVIVGGIIACGAPVPTEQAGASPQMPSPPTPAVQPTAAPTTSAIATPAASPTAPRGSTMPNPSFVLYSPEFADGDAIPSRYTCDGEDDQLPLEWSGVPKGTVELALIQHDPDAGGFVHWVVVGIPPDEERLGESLPQGARHGVNDFGRSRYNGPCPPSGSHTYVTTLFALSEPLELGDAPTARQLRQAAEGVTLATAQLRGTYRRT